MKKSVVAAIVVAAAAVLAAGAFYLLVIRPPLEFARSTAEGFRHFFHFTPQVTVNETVVVEQSAPIAELATISRTVFVETDWSHTWLHSTKRIVLRGVFEAKAGFDLHQPFTVAIQRDPLASYPRRHAVTARMPHAKILSLQLNEYHVLRDEDGWWNRLSPADREDAFRILQEEAYSKAVGSGILKESEETIEQRIREIIGNQGGDVRVVLMFDPGGSGE
jgi:hypothetical protein